MTFDRKPCAVARLTDMNKTVLLSRTLATATRPPEDTGRPSALRARLLEAWLDASVPATNVPGKRASSSSVENSCRRWTTPEPGY